MMRASTTTFNSGSLLIILSGLNTRRVRRTRSALPGPIFARLSNDIIATLLSSMHFSNMYPFQAQTHMQILSNVSSGEDIFIVSEN